MYKLRMLLVCAMAKLTKPFSDEDEMHDVNKYILYAFAYSYFFIGSLFWVLFTVWWIDGAVRLLWIASALITVPHMISVLRGFLHKQYADYQAFVISGGKHKPKNGDD